jgi:hypothetical protein
MITNAPLGTSWFYPLGGLFSIISCIFLVHVGAFVHMTYPQRSPTPFLVNIDHRYLLVVHVPFLVKTIKGVGDHSRFIVLFAYYAKNIGGGVCPFCPFGTCCHFINSTYGSSTSLCIHGHFHLMKAFPTYSSSSSN